MMTKLTKSDTGVMPIYGHGKHGAGSQGRVYHLVIIYTYNNYPIIYICIGKQTLLSGILNMLMFALVNEKSCLYLRTKRKRK